MLDGTLHGLGLLGIKLTVSSVGKDVCGIHRRNCLPDAVCHVLCGYQGRYKNEVGMIKFIMITNDAGFAQRAEAAAVERIFVDLELMGKQERQGHRDTLISSHSIDDIAIVKAVLNNAELIVRLNPLHAGSSLEIDAAIDAGAEILILPMFRQAAEVAEFCRMVDQRVRVMPLVETIGAVESLDETVTIPGVAELYIGLNDLHLERGLNFMFEPLADGLLDSMVETIKRAQLPFGFGGVARVGEGIVPGELVLAEHARLGSSSVILSRTFSHELPADNEQALAQEVQKLKSEYANLLKRDSQQVAVDRERFKTVVKEFARTRVDEASI